MDDPNVENSRPPMGAASDVPLVDLTSTDGKRPLRYGVPIGPLDDSLAVDRLNGGSAYPNWSAVAADAKATINLAVDAHRAAFNYFNGIRADEIARAVTYNADVVDADITAERWLRDAARACLAVQIAEAELELVKFQFEAAAKCGKCMIPFNSKEPEKAHEALVGTFSESATASALKLPWDGDGKSESGIVGLICKFIAGSFVGLNFFSASGLVHLSDLTNDPAWIVGWAVAIGFAVTHWYSEGMRTVSAEAASTVYRGMPSGDKIRGNVTAAAIGVGIIAVDAFVVSKGLLAYANVMNSVGSLDPAAKAAGSDLWAILVGGFVSAAYVLYYWSKGRVGESASVRNRIAEARETEARDRRATGMKDDKMVAAMVAIGAFVTQKARVESLRSQLKDTVAESERNISQIESRRKSESLELPLAHRNVLALQQAQVRGATHEFNLIVRALARSKDGRIWRWWDWWTRWDVTGRSRGGRRWRG